MQRANPTMISPVRYSGRSGSSSHASVNISAGPITQLRINDGTMSVRSVVTSPILEYRTLANTGYIISISPIAIGSETVAILTSSSQSLRSGMSRPRPRPSAIAARIHTGRNRSSRDSRSRTGASW